ncbi:MAG: AI-2E family transporter [Terriglobia bacterium]|nr:MAG: AI-2E family transporter [Terriglobia bacterium]
MLGIDRHAARSVWTAALIVLLLVLLYVVRTTLFVFILALLFAYLLSPLVNFLDRLLPSSRTRTLALALAYVIFVGLVILLGAQIGARVVEEANTLAKRFPDMLASWQKPSPSAPAPINSLKEQIVSRARAEIGSRTNDIVSALTRAGLKLLTVASDLIYVVIIPILGFFFLKDAHVIRQHILDLVDDGPRRVLLDDLLADIHLLLAHYMRALVFLSLAAFTAYSIFFAITGMPYALLLAAVAGILEFIPMIGPLTAGAIILIIAAVSGAPVLVVLIFLLAYRVVQDYVISPHLMGKGVELHPLLVLFGVFAGAELAGIAGTFLSVPTLALARVLYVRFRRARLSSRLAPTSPVRL